MKNKLSKLVYLPLGFFGSIGQPPGISGATGYGDYNKIGGGIIFFMNNLLKFTIVVAGLFTLINFMMAGYSFLSAGGDPKKITEATAKIWQSIIGLLIVAGAFVLAAIVGLLIFQDSGAIIKPKIYTP